MSQLQLFELSPAPVSPPKVWHELPFLCVDTETTGLDKNLNRVIEVAWINFDKQSEGDCVVRLCGIGENLPPEITRLTGIDDSMLQDQPPFASHADDLIAAMSKVSFIVAYNAKFDKQFLDAEMARINKRMPELPWIDPYTFIKQIDRYQKGKKLSDAAARWGVSLNGAHRAKADATATGQLLYKLVPHLKATSLTELVTMQEKWQIEQEKNFQAYLARKNGP